MRRRSLLGAVAAACSAAAGCLDSVPVSNLVQDADRDRQGQVAPAETRVGDVRVRLSVVDRQWPAPEETVTVASDCGALPVELTGWFRLHGCHGLTLASVAWDESSARLAVTLSSRWTSEKEPDEVDCGGVSVSYRLGLAPAGSPPEVVRVRYATPEGDVRDSFEVWPRRCD
jgi:hypothetical protein